MSIQRKNYFSGFFHEFVAGGCYHFDKLNIKNLPYLINLNLLPDSLSYCITVS